MSHSSGRVYLDHLDQPERELEPVGWFEYDGTSDFARPKIFPSLDEMSACWRKDQGNVTCTCGKPTTKVLIVADYGGMPGWQGYACLTCMVISARRGRDPDWAWKEQEQFGAFGFSNEEDVDWLIGG